MHRILVQWFQVICRTLMFMFDDVNSPAQPYDLQPSLFSNEALILSIWSSINAYLMWCPESSFHRVCCTPVLLWSISFEAETTKGMFQRNLKQILKGLNSSISSRGFCTFSQNQHFALLHYLGCIYTTLMTRMLQYSAFGDKIFFCLVYHQTGTLYWPFGGSLLRSVRDSKLQRLEADTQLSFRMTCLPTLFYFSLQQKGDSLQPVSW